MGVVKLAEDPALRRKVAVKLLLTPQDETARRDFLDEAQITGQLEHPNIVPVHELGTDQQGRPFLAMKRVGGRTLQSLIDERQSRRWNVDAGELLDIIGKVCDAVGYAHARGVIHRDLKPENVMVGEFGEVLLMDWGIAKPVNATDGDDGLASYEDEGYVRTAQRESTPEMTLRGELLGTPSYMSPEQAHGKTDAVDVRSDIFALGGVLYALLTLQAPYWELGFTTDRALEMAAARELVPARKRSPKRAIPKDLEAIANKAMAADPDARYQSAGELKADVQAYMSSMPITARRDPPWTRLAKWSRRHPLLTMSSTMCVVFGLVVAVLALQWQAEAERAEREATERALADAKRSEAEQESKRLAAESAQAEERRKREEEQRRIAELEAERNALLAEQARQELEDLGTRISRLLSEQSEQAIDEFYERREAYHAEGLVEWQIVRRFSEEELWRYLRAFDELFDVLEQLEHRPTVRQYQDRAFLYHYLSEQEIAIEDITAAIARVKEDEDEIDTELLASLYAQRGLLKQDLFHTRRSLADFDRALELNPELLHAYINRAITKERLEDFDGAIEDLTTLIELADHPHGYNNRGIVRRHIGDLEGAMRDFDRALERRPQFVDSRRARAQTAIDLEQWELAISDCNELIERGLLDWSHFALRGIARLRADIDRADGIADLQEAYRRSDTDAQRDWVAGILQEEGADVPE